MTDVFYWNLRVNWSGVNERARGVSLILNQKCLISLSTKQRDGRSAESPALYLQNTSSLLLSVWWIGS